jgi:ribosomal protein S18 acetylase RimI-like enzyme
VARIVEASSHQTTRGFHDLDPAVSKVLLSGDWDTSQMPKLRRATDSDAPGMQRVAEAAYSPYLPRMGGQRPGPMDTDYRAAVTDAEGWVAEADGEVVGFLILVGEDDGMLLEGVAVLPAHQGQGLGRALLVLAEGRAAAAGHTRIRLYTHETMVENQHLYERIGYAETHRATERGFTRVFYEKSLPTPPA